MANRFLGKGILAVVATALTATQVNAELPRRPSSKVLMPRFQFKIDPKASFAELLPKAPKPQAAPLYPEKLTDVPEAMFEALPIPEAKKEKEDERDRRGFRGDFKNMERVAHTLAKISHLNKHRPDYFMHVLLQRRPDLQGLPFTMGDACRMKPEQNLPFRFAVSEVQGALSIAVERRQAKEASESKAQEAGLGLPKGALADPAEAFWQRYDALKREIDANRNLNDQPPIPEARLMVPGRIAALMQMLGPQSADTRVGLVKYLAGLETADATRALAKLAVFSPEDKVRGPALEALKNRPQGEYTSILLDGLRYPWPAVAENAADAIATLKRSDLVEQLIKVFDEPDPRDPVTQKQGDTEKTIVRHLARINHHRNCALCHAPANPDNMSGDIVTGAVPPPGDPFDSLRGYRGSSPDILVRVDVTYLRQDFSQMLHVANAAPWPEQQRFDFLVRTRTLTADEAEAYKQEIAKRGEDYVSPYHRAAESALRTLTGRNEGRNAAAWRRTLQP